MPSEQMNGCDLGSDLPNDQGAFIIMNDMLVALPDDTMAFGFQPKFRAALEASPSNRSTSAGRK